MNSKPIAEDVRMQGILAEGYGIMPQIIARNKKLPIEARAIYAYLTAFSGSSFKPVFPSRELMLEELNISKNRFYKNMQLLIDMNLVAIERSVDGNIFGKNIYTLVLVPDAGSGTVRVKKPARISKRLDSKGNRSKAVQEEFGSFLEAEAKREEHSKSDQQQSKPDREPETKSVIKPEIKPDQKTETKLNGKAEKKSNSNSRGESEINPSRNLKSNTNVKKEEKGALGASRSATYQTETLTRSAGNNLSLQLGIPELLERRPEDKALIEYIHMAIEDMAASEQITVSGSIKKKDAIKNMIQSLRIEHIEALVNNISGSGQTIKRKKAYIQSCIWNISFDLTGPMDFSGRNNAARAIEMEEAERDQNTEKELYEQNPKLREIDDQINQLGYEISKAILSGNELKTKALQIEKERLNEEREEVINRMNLTSNA